MLPFINTHVGANPEEAKPEEVQADESKREEVQADESKAEQVEEQNSNPSPEGDQPAEQNENANREPDFAFSAYNTTEATTKVTTTKKETSTYKFPSRLMHDEFERAGKSGQLKAFDVSLYGLIIFLGTQFFLM